MGVSSAVPYWDALISLRLRLINFSRGQDPAIRQCDLPDEYSLCAFFPWWRAFDGDRRSELKGLIRPSGLDHLRGNSCDTNPVALSAIWPHDLNDQFRVRIHDLHLFNRSLNRSEERR